MSFVVVRSSFIDGKAPGGATAFCCISLSFSALHDLSTGYAQDSSSAVRSGSQPAPSFGRHLLGQKGARVRHVRTPTSLRLCTGFAQAADYGGPYRRSETRPTLKLLFSVFFCLFLFFSSYTPAHRPSLSFAALHRLYAIS